MYAENDPTWGTASNLPKGYRAVGLKVTLEGSVHGWATLPMSRVDVINTVRRGGDKDSFAHFLLQDVLVLAIDAKDIREDNGRPMTGSVVTFALSPDDCLRLSLARDMGTLSLALRNIHDRGVGGSGVVTGDQITDSTRGALARNEEAAAENMPFGLNPMSQAIDKFDKLPGANGVPVQPAVEVTKEAKGPDGHTHRLEVRQGTVSTTSRYLLDNHDRPIPTDERRPE
jgi:Flp pilus assembly protein CpaB